MRLVLGHSPDPDDAYIFYGLATGRVRHGFEFREFLADIETLNRLAMHERLDVSAVSVHALAYIADRYYVLTVGASVGVGYGPVVVGRHDPKLVAVPGRNTTAALLLRMAMPEVKVIDMPFDKILDAVEVGVVDAGVLIHEAQLAYAEKVELLVDLGEWWMERSGLPLPLGVNVVRAGLGEDVARDVKRILRESIAVADSERREAIRYAARFARGLPERGVERFVDLYVNEYARDLGRDGMEAVSALLDEAYRAGLVPRTELRFI